ncbi:E3 ubiquitin-protein ligase RLIM-like [Gossypium australe]|uniref:E3 ubiquitin-protein ligase RLIM-like n=1 Tax=Gossypium australe TaxID=47621 RepID=A0A5B6X4H5_9ROSI|nr:E3 ubiquitin-protein ligase RLIM-like [Gossypium australe]
MTSASELFYTRRSRVGRPDPDSGIGSSIERNYHRRNHLSHHNQRHDLDGGDSLRRSPHVRHFSSRASSLSERSSVRFDEGTSELVSSNGLNAVGVSNARRQSLRSSERLAREGFDEGTGELSSSHGLNADGVSSSSRQSLRANERLPGAVLLARARLVERLRGVSVSANRRSNRAPPNAYHREHVTGDDFRIISELSTGLAARGSPLTSEAERFELLRETNKKPPGLTQEALDRLPLEIFGSQDVNVERKTSRESRDCSICLESFGEGDVLTQLPCGHRFHFACLDPWLRTCGDCPYCRSIL